MAFRFVHTADIHLDSPLRSLAFRKADLANIVETATRTAFSRTVDLCIETEAEALLIAGDLYDGSSTSMKTAAFLAAELDRLAKADIRCFIIRGNHDAASAITRRLDLPPSTHAFSGRKHEVVEFTARDGAPIAVHGLSFKDRHAPQSLLSEYKYPIPDRLNIGLMHTSLDGAAGHDPYAPTSVASLKAHGFDYWALGHIHIRSVHDGGRIVMPGIPQGRHINEGGQKSVTLVDLDESGPTLAEHAVAEAGFQRVTATIAGDMGGNRQILSAAIADARAQQTADHAILRLILTPAAESAFQVRRDSDLIRATAADIAERLDRTWIEKIEITAPADAPTPNADGGPEADLEACIAEALAAPSFKADALALIEDMAADLPAGAADALGASPEDIAARVEALAAAGAAEALEALLRPEETAD